MITATYAALLALLFITLSVLVILQRRRARVSLGDAGNAGLQRAIRVHANFSEYIPLALLLIYFVETTTALAWLVHVLGVSLLIGRLSHAWGVSHQKEDFRFRVAGMMLTFGIIGVAALVLLAMAVLRLTT